MSSLVVLAYSGGLDTSAIVPWLRETHGVRVLCFAADVGQGGMEGIREKALDSGAVDCVVEDLREPFVREFIFPTLKAGATYGRAYLLGTAMARPLIASAQVLVAREVGATGLAHGCTGKGNDQVRFELTYAAMAPDLDVIAPWRSWDIRSREELIQYVQSRGIPVPVTAAKPFSRDQNLWHCSHEGGILEDPSVAPPEDLFLLTASPEAAPDQSQEVTLGFDAGIPVMIDGSAMGPVQLLECLNEMVGAHGIGRADIVEDRLVGMKSRGVYETPGGTLLYYAHRELEQLVLNRRTLALKDHLGDEYARLVYDGLWWTPEREAIDAFVHSTQRKVTGTVTVKLFKGTMTTVSRESPYSLYRPDYATFDGDDVYDQHDATGFIKLFGLDSRIAADVPRSRPAAVNLAAD